MQLSCAIVLSFATLALSIPVNLQTRGHHDDSKKGTNVNINGDIPYNGNYPGPNYYSLGFPGQPRSSPPPSTDSNQVADNASFAQFSLCLKEKCTDDLDECIPQCMEQSKSADGQVNKRSSDDMKNNNKNYNGNFYYNGSNGGNGDNDNDNDNDNGNVNVNGNNMGYFPGGNNSNSNGNNMGYSSGDRNQDDNGDNEEGNTDNEEGNTDNGKKTKDMKKQQEKEEKEEKKSKEKADKEKSKEKGKQGKGSEDGGAKEN